MVATTTGAGGAAREGASAGGATREGDMLTTQEGVAREGTSAEGTMMEGDGPGVVPSCREDEPAPGKDLDLGCSSWVWGPLLGPAGAGAKISFVHVK